MATFKDPNFWSLHVFGKTWTYSQDQDSKVRIFNLFMNWENVCPNLGFTVESKMGEHTQG